MKENNPNVKHNHEQLVNPSKEKQSSHILLFPETHIRLMIHPPTPPSPNTLRKGKRGGAVAFDTILEKKIIVSRRFGASASASDNPM